MFFSEIIEQVGKGHYVLNKENQKIFVKDDIDHLNQKLTFELHLFLTM